MPAQLTFLWLFEVPLPWMGKLLGVFIEGGDGDGERDEEHWELPARGLLRCSHKWWSWLCSLTLCWPLTSICSHHCGPQRPGRSLHVPWVGEGSMDIASPASWAVKEDTCGGSPGANP